MDFWDYALAQKRRTTAWGDYLHRLGSGDVPRPPAVSHWHEAVNICERALVNVDREEVRLAWYGYTQHRKKRETHG